MARTPRVPVELTRGPFSLREARDAGLTLSALRGNSWTRLGSELYCWRGIRENLRLLLSKLQASLPSEAIFTSATAGWLSGLDLEPTNPIHVAVPPGSGVRPRVGLAVRRCVIPPSDAVTVRGLRATTLRRTLLDLCLELPAVEALVAIDMAIRSGLTDVADLCRYAETAKRRPGARRLASLAALAAPAESPMETRLRWLLIEAGLPRPEVQTDLRDGEGRFVGRADLFYPSAGLVLEYDGGNHRDRLVEDDRRQNLILSAGFRLLRFTAADLNQRPDIVESQVRVALGTPVQNTRLRPNARNSKHRKARLAPNARNWWRRLLTS